MKRCTNRLQSPFIFVLVYLAFGKRFDYEITRSKCEPTCSIREKVIEHKSVARFNRLKIKPGGRVRVGNPVTFFNLVLQSNYITEERWDTSLDKEFRSY